MGDITILLFCAEKQFLGIYLENMKSYRYQARMLWNISTRHSEIWKISTRSASPEGPLPTSSIFFIFPRSRLYISYHPRLKAIYSIFSCLDTKNLFFFYWEVLFQRILYCNIKQFGQYHKLQNLNFKNFIFSDFFA